MKKKSAPRVVFLVAYIISRTIILNF